MFAIVNMHRGILRGLDDENREFVFLEKTTSTTIRSQSPAQEGRVLLANIYMP